MGRYDRKKPHQRTALIDCQYGDILEWPVCPIVRLGSDAVLAPSKVGCVSMRLGPAPHAILCRFYLEGRDWRTEPPNTEPMHVVSSRRFKMLKARP